MLIFNPKSEVLRHKNDKQPQAASFRKSGRILWMPRPSSRVKNGVRVRPHELSYIQKIFLWNFYDMQLLPLQIRVNIFP
jgi:hypothetical protein